MRVGPIPVTLGPDEANFARLGDGRREITFLAEEEPEQNNTRVVAE